MDKKIQDALATWIDLNDMLRDATEEQCQQLLKAESESKNRKAFVARIHSRLNKARADRERKELGI